ncbi:hypothetical protein [Nocardia sp. SSK8]|uniref:hypothetical protein n=1 Tax=Nocardia sp. SSK8 TaxID=3120154 RepID=UPI003008C3CF
MRTTALVGSLAGAALAIALALPSAATANPVSPVADNCHPSYDPCVPINSDVDCIGGNGDGPGYSGRVRVIGPDEYELDDDGNGIGCELV